MNLKQVGEMLVLGHESRVPGVDIQNWARIKIKIKVADFDQTLQYGTKSLTYWIENNTQSRVVVLIETCNYSHNKELDYRFYSTVLRFQDSSEAFLFKLSYVEDDENNT